MQTKKCRYKSKKYISTSTFSPSPLAEGHSFAATKVEGK